MTRLPTKAAFCRGRSFARRSLGCTQVVVPDFDGVLLRFRCPCGVHWMRRMTDEETWPDVAVREAEKRGIERLR